MNRRDFIKRLAIGTVGLAVVARVPLEYVPVSRENKRAWAIQYLTKRYNEYVKGKGAQFTPKYISVSEELFHAYEGELIWVQRFVSKEIDDVGYRNLYFKTATLMADSHLTGKEVLFHQSFPEWRRNTTGIYNG